MAMNWKDAPNGPNSEALRDFSNERRAGVFARCVRRIINGSELEVPGTGSGRRAAQSIARTLGLTAIGQSTGMAVAALRPRLHVNEGHHLALPARQDLGAFVVNSVATGPAIERSDCSRWWKVQRSGRGRRSRPQDPEDAIQDAPVIHTRDPRGARKDRGNQPPFGVGKACRMFRAPFRSLNDAGKPKFNVGSATDSVEEVG